MIGITGSTGHLGRLVIENLLERGVPANQIVALARNVDKAQDFAKRGVNVRQADYDAPDTLPAALQGIDRLLMISANEVGRRFPQHRNVVDAARTAGVRLIAYTSITRADVNQMQLATEHRATEEYIEASGIPFVFLRNSWYLENYTEHLGSALERGVLLGSAEDGRISAATRADYAAAAAGVLIGDGYENQILELGGDEAFTMAQLAAEISQQSGKSVEYRNVPEAEYAAVLTQAGLPEPVARMLADSDRGIARGELFVESGDLRRLIGRETTPIENAVREGLRN